MIHVRRRVAFAALLGVLAATTMSLGGGAAATGAVGVDIVTVHRVVRAVVAHVRWWYTEAVSDSALAFNAVIIAELTCTVALIMLIVSYAERLAR